MAVTIKEIAKLADVSAATVSMVLNDKEGISPVTRERVLKIAKDKGYSFSKKSNAAKGNLQLTIYKKHSKVVNDTPFFQTLIEGIESEARHNSYKLNITYISSHSDITSVMSDAKKHSVDGMLLLGTEMEEEDFVKFLNFDIPILLLDSNFVDVNSNSVVIDNVSGTYKGTKYFIEKGHTQIGYLKSSISIQNFKERFEGYRKALNEHQIEFDPGYVIPLMPNMDGAYKDMKAYLAGKPNLATAYIADNDLIAMGAIKAIKELSINIPDQVSIIGFDDMPFSMMVEPALTTISVDKKFFGRLAVDNLIDIIQGKNRSFFKTVLGVDLVERKSVRDLNKSL